MPYIIISVVFVAIILLATFLFYLPAKREVSREDPDRRAYEAISASHLVILFVSIFLALVTILFSTTIVSTGNVKVLKAFGKVNPTEPALIEGFHVVAPWKAAVVMDVRQQTLNRNVSDSTNAKVLAGDDTLLDMDVSFHWRLQPTAAPYIYQRFGEQYWEFLQVPSAAGALRSVIGSLSEWSKVTKDKVNVEETLTSVFASTVEQKLLAAGMPKDIAATAFVFPKTDIRRVMPPEQILTAIANKKAAEQELERQQTEIEIVKKKAKKGSEEGRRIHNIISSVYGGKIPDSLTAADIVAIINAIATKQNAQSIQSAVENGDVNMIIAPASGAAVSVGK